MWFNNIAKGLQEQVEKAGQDLGLKETLANAQARLGNLSEDLLDVKTGAQTSSPALAEDNEDSQYQRAQNEYRALEETPRVPESPSEVVSQPPSIDVYKEENSLLRRELRDMKMTRNVLHHEKRHVQAAADALGEVEEVKEKFLLAQNGIASKDQRIAQLLASNNKLDARLTASEEKSATLEQAARIAMDESAQLRKEMHNKETLFKKQKADHEDTVNGLRAQLAEAKSPATPESKFRPAAESDSRSPDGISAQSQSEDTQSEMQSMKVKLQKAKRTLDNMKKREAEAVAAKAQAEARAAELEAQLSQVSQSSEAHDVDEGLKAQCRQLQNQVVDLEHDLATVTERYRVAQREEGSQAESLSTELNDLRARLRRSEEGRVDAQHKLRDLRTTLDDNQTQLAGLQRLRQELGSAKDACTEAEASVAELEAQVSGMRSEAEQASLLTEQSMASKQAELDAKIEELNSAATQLAELRSKSVEQEDAFQVLTTHAANLSQERDEFQAQCQALQAQLSESSARQDKILALEEQLLETQHRFSEAQDVITDLQSQVAKLTTKQIACGGAAENADQNQIGEDKDREPEQENDVQNAAETGEVRGKKARRRNRKKGNKAGLAAVADQGGAESDQGTVPEAEANGSLAAITLPVHASGLEEGLQGNPLYSPTADVTEPSTPPARDFGLPSSELRQQLQETQEELGKQKQLVAELQEKLAAALQFPPGLSPRSLQKNATFGAQRIVDVALQGIREENGNTDSPAKAPIADLQQPQKEDTAAGVTDLHLHPVSEDLKAAQQRILELESELSLRSRLGTIAAKVSALESQRSQHVEGNDTQQSGSIESSRPSSAETDTSNVASVSSHEQSAPGVPPKPISRRKSKDQLGAVQQRILSLEEQLASAKQSARHRIASEHRLSQNEEQESADVAELKQQLQVARQASQDLGLLQKQAERQQSEANALTVLVDKLRSDLAAECASRDHAQQEAQSHAKENQRLQADQSSHALAMANLRKQILEHETDTQALRDRLERLSEKEAEVHQLKDKLESLEQKNADLESAQQKAADLLSEGDLTVKSLQGELADVTSQLETLNDSHTSLLEKTQTSDISAAESAAAKEQDLKNLRKHIEEANSRTSSLQEEIASAEQRLQSLTAELDSANTALHGQQEENKKLQSRVKDLEDEKLKLSGIVKSRSDELASLKDDLASRQNALDAVRDGSNAELKMAVTARKNAESRAAKAEEALKQVQQELGQAEERVEAAMKEARDHQERAQSRLLAARGEVDKAEERMQQLHSRIKQLQEESQKRERAAREAAQAAAAEARKEAEAQQAQAVQTVQAEAEAMRADLLQKLEAFNQQIQDARGAEAGLRTELAEAHTSLQTLADSQREISELKRSLDAAHELQCENAAKLEAAEKAAGQEKTVALERQKRFNLLNSQFRKKEVEFTKQVQAVQSRLEEREQTVTSLQAEGQSHQQALEETSARFRTAEAECNEANKQRDAAMQQLESARQELVRLRQELNTVRARVEALQEQPSGMTQEAADLRVQQAVKETEARNQAQLEEAEAALQAAREEVRHADERATAAEMAKIQLSMRIAELDDARAAQLSTNEQTLGSPSSPQNTPPVEGSASGIVQLGGLPENMSSTTRLLDIFGCAINNRR